MYRALLFAGLAATASAFAPAGVLPKAATARAAVSRGPSMQDRFAYKTSCGYDIQAPYWDENGGLFRWPDVIWAREAEVKVLDLCVGGVVCWWVGVLVCEKECVKRIYFCLFCGLC